MFLTAGAVVTVLVIVLAVLVVGRLADRARHTLTAAVGDTRAATVDLVSGAQSVTVRSGDLGDDLYRIGTPGDAADVPRIARDGDAVRVSLESTGDGPGGTVEILLSDRVTWQVRLSGGADDVRVDLRGAPFARLDLASGTASAEVWLPEPRGTAILEETGGVNRLAIHVPDRAPVRLAVQGGAGSVTLNGTVHNGVSGGRSFTTDGWDAADDRYDIRLVGGVSTVSVA